MKSPRISSEQADLRVRRTRKLLWEALMMDLSERAFEEITVQDICERAMVHRTTFYKHYEDKYDLLAQGMRRMFDALISEEEHKPPSAYSVDDPPPYFVRLFEHAAQHQRFYQLMLCGEGIGPFQKLIKEYIVGVVSANARELPQATRRFTVPATMHAQFVAGATLSLLAWWVENDMPLTPRQMAQYLMAPHDVSFAPS